VQEATRGILNSLFPSWLPGAFKVSHSCVAPPAQLHCALVQQLLGTHLQQGLQESSWDTLQSVCTVLSQFQHSRQQERAGTVIARH
jgi:hypothetical protein